ncbi:MAG: Flp pilus assembly protein CpaB [Deltaproteobacteria bacterium]|nr:Flp pilus assembly protein CpaB [Deltaproteobacteria bacterium]MBN2673850.1 Flp pilus assembly protein CpaB [Deltaproteobacteria bacterium]
MNRFIVVSLVCASMAGAFHFLYLRNIERRQIGGDVISIVVASSNMKKGKILIETDLAVREVPMDFVDKRTVRQKEMKRLAGLPLMVSLSGGEALQWTDVQERNWEQSDDLANYVESGKRAMSIVVTNESALGGLLRPGHRVDIIGTFTRKSSVTNSQSKTLLQNIMVLATGDQLSGEIEKRGYGTVTLNVNLEESELLAMAEAQGELSLVLRGHEDLVYVEKVPPVTIETVFSENNKIRNELSSSHSIAIERLETSN